MTDAIREDGGCGHEAHLLGVHGLGVASGFSGAPGAAPEESCQGKPAARPVDQPNADQPAERDQEGGRLEPAVPARGRQLRPITEIASTTITSSPSSPSTSEAT